MNFPKENNSECCVIIVTYNGEKWIEKCIRTLLEGSVAPQIMVVDNGSTDATLSILSPFSEVAITQAGENLGFGRANNVALKAGYEQGFNYFFLLNQDTYVERETVEQLIKAAKTNPHFGVVSPIHMNGAGTAFDHTFERYMGKGHSNSFLTDVKNDSLKESIYEVPFVNAAAWMITRENLEKVGLFHPLFHHYGEDNNYVHRVHHQGLRIGVIATTRIFHDREGRPDNSLKVDPQVKFRRVMLQQFLNPGSRRMMVFKYVKALKELKSISKGWPLGKRIDFFKWGSGKFFETSKEVSALESLDYNPLKSE